MFLINAGEEDAELIVEIRNECKEFLHTQRNFTVEECKNFISKNPNYYKIVFSDLMIPIGYIRYQLDTFNMILTIGCDVHKKYRGKGWGKNILSFVISNAFEKGINRVELEVIETNERAMGLYFKLGFKEEGVKRNAVWTSNGYVNSIVMGMLKDDFNAL